MLKLFIFASLISSVITFAEVPNATVVKVRGKATTMSSTSHGPKKITVKDVLNYDSSVLVEKNSYVTLKLSDKLGFIKAGKSSKFTIRLEAEEKIFYVNLLKGYIKILFNKSEAADKMIIKTSSAVVEATKSKFIVVSNPLTKTTTVFNTKGDVQLKTSLESEGTIIPPHKYSYLRRNQTNATEPKVIPEQRIKELKSIFDISAKKKVETL